MDCPAGHALGAVVIWIITIAAIISLAIGIITLKVVHHRSAPHPLRIPYVGPSRLEKFGVDVHVAAVSADFGHDWIWVQGQFAGREYWLTTSPAAPRVRVRRKSWPVAYFKKGTRFSSDNVIDHDFFRPWHVWRSSDTGDQSTFIGGLCQGWGGQMGSDHDEDDFVMVNGVREHDGTGYRPDAEDLAATDWELAFPICEAEKD